MSVRVKVIDGTLVVVLHNGEQEIERELAPPADALRIALMMLARAAGGWSAATCSGDGPELNDDGGGVKRYTSLTRRRCFARARTSAPLGGPDR
jgi:hypothetical protein